MGRRKKTRRSTVRPRSGGGVRTRMKEVKKIERQIKEKI